MAIIKLTKGYEAIIDDWRHRELTYHSWYVKEGRYNSVYAARSARKSEWPTQRMIFLHHQVLNIMPWELDGKIVDHINRNSLDCREENLRLTTQAINIQNSYAALNARGVSYSTVNKRWQATLLRPGLPRKHLGTAATEEEALRLVAEARREE
jgi:hypothetical protein